MTTQYLNDRYEILQQLGKRTGRETLLARDLSTEKLVVIKLLKFNSEFEWDDLKLFEREALILQELSHPAIPQYLDYFEFEVPQYKGFALVQTYLEAKSLEQHRQAGRTFTEDEVKEIAEQLLEILSYLHDLYPPVIHRDLKPSNILLEDRSAHSVGKIYLVDFGSVQNIAANVDKLELTSQSYRRKSKGTLVAVPPQINIWAGVKKIELGKGGLLSEPELEWLAQELSICLNLPISKN